MFDKLKKFLSTFDNLTKEKLAEIERHTSMVSLAKGDFFLKAGRISHQIGFVAEGIFRVYQLEDHQEITCAFAQENQFVVDLDSFNLHQPATEYIQALTEAHLIVISHRQLQNLFAKLPEFMHLYQQILQKSLLDKLKIKNIFLTEEPSQRYEFFLTHYPDIIQRVPLIHIASYLGITPQSLSRIRKNLV